MSRRYTLLGGAIALTVGVMYAIWRAAAPDAPRSAIILGGVALGCFLGWAASRRDALDLLRLHRLVDALLERNYDERARLGRSGPIGDLGRVLDALA
ncbi:MAG: hypothetical protein WCF10_16240, partial [Polyangiales bacterium]